jgi:hypothetical protein
MMSTAVGCGRRKRREKQYTSAPLPWPARVLSRERTRAGQGSAFGALLLFPSLFSQSSIVQARRPQQL